MKTVRVTEDAVRAAQVEARALLTAGLTPEPLLLELAAAGPGGDAFGAMRAAQHVADTERVISALNVATPSGTAQVRSKSSVSGQFESSARISRRPGSAVGYKSGGGGETAFKNGSIEEQTVTIQGDLSDPDIQAYLKEASDNHGAGVVTLIDGVLKVTRKP